MQKIAFDERKRLYNEVQAVERTLRKQIENAIQDDYLRPLRNSVTDTITVTIQEIFTFLKDSYGDISKAVLKERERAVDDMIYDPSQTVDSVFNKIDDFQDLCVLTNHDKTDTQLCTMAYLIFQNTGIFMDSLKSWNQKPRVEQSYANMKMFMRREYLEL